MTAVLPITITRFADESQPGWVECELSDAFGRLHRFTEKVPIVSIEDLRKESSYPCSGNITCEIISEWVDEEDRALSKVNTSRPHGIESMDGVTQFTVPSALLSRNVLLS